MSSVVEVASPLPILEATAVPVAGRNIEYVDCGERVSISERGNPSDKVSSQGAANAPLPVATRLRYSAALSKAIADCLRAYVVEFGGRCLSAGCKKRVQSLEECCKVINASPQALASFLQGGRLLKAETLSTFIKTGIEVEYRHGKAKLEAGSAQNAMDKGLISSIAEGYAPTDVEQAWIDCLQVFEEWKVSERTRAARPQVRTSNASPITKATQADQDDLREALVQGDLRFQDVSAAHASMADPDELRGLDEVRFRQRQEQRAGEMHALSLARERREGAKQDRDTLQILLYEEERCFVRITQITQTVPSMTDPSLKGNMEKVLEKEMEKYSKLQGQLEVARAKCIASLGEKLGFEDISHP